MLLPFAPFSASCSTSGPSLLRRLSTSLSLVGIALALEPFALISGLLADEPELGAGRAGGLCAGDEDDAAAGCLPKKLNSVACVPPGFCELILWVLELDLRG